MDLFLEITNIWQKSRDFWFADFFLEIFKKAGMDIPMILVVLNLFHQNIYKKIKKYKSLN